MEEGHLHFASSDSVTNEDVPIIPTRDPQLVHKIIHWHQPCFRNAIKFKVLCTAGARSQHTLRQAEVTRSVVLTNKFTDVRQHRTFVEIA